MVTITVIAAVLLSSCAPDSNASSDEVPVEIAASLTTDNLEPTYPAGELLSIRSSNVAAAGYDPTTQVMTVRFLSGGLYEYYKVPEDLWLDFLAAQPSPWSQVGHPRLVQGGYAYRRVG